MAQLQADLVERIARPLDVDGAHRQACVAFATPLQDAAQSQRGFGGADTRYRPGATHIFHIRSHHPRRRQASKVRLPLGGDDRLVTGTDGRVVRKGTGYRLRQRKGLARYRRRTKSTCQQQEAHTA
ncbi:hypothetical protein RLIN73S_01444 [Rhodanobacter lindaniclasticus]